MNSSYRNSRGCGDVSHHGSNFYREGLRRLLTNHCIHTKERVTTPKKEDIVERPAKADISLLLLGTKQYL